MHVFVFGFGYAAVVGGWRFNVLFILFVRSEHVWLRFTGDI